MKNFTKILSLLLAFVLVLGTITVVSADREFSDLSASHWAYANVQTLVADGTINGYQDGTFRPDAGVTRAEFVKMIGKTDKSFEKTFDDISGHWAYDYIMYSDMDVEGTSFRPDEPMTRGDIVALLWKRAGSPVAVAPSIITNQSNNSDAAAWAYAYGVMNGDDGINLRLEDGVTRAEAAALICRSRVATPTRKSFEDSIDERLIEAVYEGLYYNSEYQADKTFTNGEIAGLAMKLAFENTMPLFDGINIDKVIDRPETLSFFVACKYIWGEDKMTEEFYDAKANNLDTIAALTFACDFKSTFDTGFDSFDIFYDDVKSVRNDTMNLYVSAACKNGIRFDNTNNIYPTDTIDAKSLGSLLIQFDALAGFESSTYIAGEAYLPLDSQIDYNIAKYPANYKDFKYILKDIPNKVYASPFIDVDGSVCNRPAKDTYRFAYDNSDIFIFFLQRISAIIYNTGADTTIVYSPSLVVESDNGYIMKVRIKIHNIDDSTTFDDVFPNIVTGEKPEFKPGSEFYATIATGRKLAGINIPIDEATFTSFEIIK